MVARSLSYLAVALVALAASATATSGCDSSTNTGPASSSGGSAGTGGNAGGGGMGPQCTSADECGQQNNPCLEAACVHQVCSFVPTKGGSPLPDATPGDCKKSVCDGAGHSTDAADDTDVPTSTDCVAKSCNAGMVVSKDLALGTACTGGC